MIGQFHIDSTATVCIVEVETFQGVEKIFYINKTVFIYIPATL